MRLPVMVMLAVAFAGACGGSSKTTPSAQPQGSGTTVPQGSGTTVHVAQAATNTPSVSAKMICGPEALKLINDDIGVKPVKPISPTWVDHVYSCDLVYKGGATMTLSVKEVSTEPETTAYFDGLAKKLGNKETQVIGQGAFVTAKGSVVVRKDYKVLLVDVSKLPEKFGYDTRTNDAINVAYSIMECWVGA
jgi:hypothetical protein